MVLSVVARRQLGGSADILLGRGFIFVSVSYCARRCGGIRRCRKPEICLFAASVKTENAFFLLLAVSFYLVGKEKESGLFDDCAERLRAWLEDHGCASVQRLQDACDERLHGNRLRNSSDLDLVAPAIFGEVKGLIRLVEER